ALTALAQVLAKPCVAAQFIIARHPTVEHLMTPRLKHLQALRLPRVILHLRRHVARFCREVRFLGKIQKLGVRNSMTYRVPNARKSNFATEPPGAPGYVSTKRSFVQQILSTSTGSARVRC